MSDGADDPFDALVRAMPDGRPVYYVLDEQGEAKPWAGTLRDWASRLAALGPDRILVESRIIDPSGRTRLVITAFLGVDEAAALLQPAERPEVFGTILWEEQREFFDATRAEALARHDRIVAALLTGQEVEA
jgi:hypothetical protein